MKLRFGLLASAAVIGFLGAGSAEAADLYASPPPPVYGAGPSSCFYVRADVAGVFLRPPAASALVGTPFTGASDVASGESATPTAAFELGVGCQITELLRVEAVGGYRMRSTITDPTGSLNMGFQTFTGMVNAYWDITTYGGFTPYLGAGIGGAYHMMTGVTAPATATAASDLSLAWNVMAGVSYDLTQNMKLDVGYRYSDLGSFTSGGATPILMDRLNAHEVKIGVRVHFD